MRDKACMGGAGWGPLGDGTTSHLEPRLHRLGATCLSKLVELRWGQGVQAAQSRTELSLTRRKTTPEQGVCSWTPPPELLVELLGRAGR